MKDECVDGGFGWRPGLVTAEHLEEFDMGGTTFRLMDICAFEPGKRRSIADKVH